MDGWMDGWMDGYLELCFLIFLKIRIKSESLTTITDILLLRLIFKNIIMFGFFNIFRALIKRQ